jgi:hypothetical protein
MSAIGGGGFATAVRLGVEQAQHGPLGQVADSKTTQGAAEALFPSQKLLAGRQQDVGKAVRDIVAQGPEYSRAAVQLVRQHAEMAFSKAAEGLVNSPDGSQNVGALFNKLIAGQDQQILNLKAGVEALPDGARRWAGFQRFLEICKATGYRMPIGSRTAFNEKAMETLSKGGIAGTAVKYAAAPGEWMHVIHDWMGKWQLGSNMREMAQILTDPKSGPLLSKLIDLKGTSTAGQAGAIAARLIMQARGASGGGPDSREPSEQVDQLR